MKATICDVGPRDGLQNEPEPLSAQVRAVLVNRLAAVGVPRIEGASFVHPERVPQMAGAEEVAAGIEPRDGTMYAGLVLNEKGYERLAATAVDEVQFSFGATETFNRRNANASVDVETGIDLEGLIAVAAWLEEILSRELPGQIYRAGTFAPVAG